MRYLILLLTLCLAACGTPRHSTSEADAVGPGHIVLGQPRATVESHNSGWKVEREEVLSPTSHRVTYQDWHWSLAHGWVHGSEHHTIIYTNGQVASWTSN